MARETNSKPKFRGNSKRKFSKNSNPAKEESVVKVSKPNDPEWYTRNPQLVKDVASISFNNAAGARVNVQSDNPGGDTVINTQVLTLPGILSITTMPFMGVAIGPTAPINIAAKQLYTYVRHANSGHSNYDSPDLMLYVMAMDSIYAGIAAIQRAIGTANLFSQVNRYVMDAMLEAEGFSPDSVRNNLADNRARLNMLILKANAFCVPATMTLFKRHMWMYSGIYQDSPVAKSQFYVYKPGFLYRYNEASGGAGYLEPVQIMGAIVSNPDGTQCASFGYTSIDQWFMKLENMLSRLIESEDINIMSGDILKAYGRENLFTMAPVTEDYTVVPFYSEEVLDQIHNTMFTSSYIRTVSDLSNADQVKKQNTACLQYTQVVSVQGNYLICVPKFAGVPHLSVSKLLDMADNEPTPERVIVATRNMLSGDTSSTQVTGVDSITTLTQAGSDLCLSADIISAGLDGTNWGYKIQNGYNNGVYNNVMLEKFQRAPIGYRGAFSSGSYTPDLPFFELGNYTVVTSDVIAKMHETAILSMLGVPV